MTEPTDLLARIQAYKDAKAQKSSSKPPLYQAKEDHSDYEDLVPDEDSTYHRTDADIALDNAVQNIGIIEAYNRWIHKSTPDAGSRRSEGIKISCPMPDHPDKNPSAWLNTDKNVWHCAACEKGGDQFDLAAIGLGYDYDHYKSDKTFGRLKRQMAEDFGYSFMPVPGTREQVIVTSEAPAPTPSPVTTPAPVNPKTTGDDDISAPLATVTNLFTGEPVSPETIGIEWRDIVPEQTFLRTYLEMVTQDDCPEEYHFWNGLVAISLAIGRDVTLKEASPVHGNLFVCLLGTTGHGKSRSQSYLKKLLSTALPYDDSDPMSKGAKIISAPGSAEVLINAFRKPITDPSGGGAVLGFAPVRGYIDFNELATLMGRANRQGNVLKPQLQELYDAGDMRTQSMTRGDLIAKDTYGCVISTSQPDSLRGLLTEDDAKSGFLNRWVFAFARNKPRVAINRFVADLAPASDQLKAIHGWAGFGKSLDWSDEAEAAYVRYFHDVCEPAMDRSKGILSRLGLLTKKLTLLFAANAKHDVVQISDVETMMALHDYLVDAFLNTETSVEATRTSDIENKLLELIREFEHGDKKFTAREAHQRMRKTYRTNEINTALDDLVKADLLSFYNPNAGKAGRPTRVFFIPKENEDA